MEARNIALALALLAGAGCHTVGARLPEIETEGVFETEFGDAGPLTLTLERRDGALRGVGSLGGRPVVFQELPERRILGRLLVDGSASVPVVLRFGAGDAATLDGTVELDLAASAAAGEAFEPGPRSGRYRRRSGGGGVDLVDVTQIGSVLVGEANAFGRRFALVAEISEGGALAGRLEARDGSALHIRGQFTGPGEITIEGAGAPSVLRR